MISEVVVEKKVALLAGASGLIGKQLLALLLKEPMYEKVVVLVRRSLPIEHAKLIQCVVDFSADNFGLEVLQGMTIDHAFCTLGTTIKKAGSKVKFRQVDQHYATKVAMLAKNSGASLFAIVTAMAANSDSKIFYNQVKGDVENALQKVNFQYLAAFRPSMLMGDRQEYRLSEHLGSLIMKAFGFLIPSNYKIIHVNKVAAAMLDYAKNPVIGFCVISSGSMNKNYPS